MAEYFSWGFIEVFIDANHGHIERAQIFSDALFPDLIESYQGALSGKSYSGRGIYEASQEVLEKHSQYRLEVSELSKWLASQTEIS